METNTKSTEPAHIDACDCDACWSVAVAAFDAANGIIRCSRCAQSIGGDIDRDAAGLPLCWSGCRGGRGPHSTAEVVS